jgi:hypothetical protein
MMSYSSTTTVGSCAKSFTPIQNMDRNTMALRHSSSTTALSVCSLAVVVVIFTSADPSSAPPPLTFLIVVSVLVVYAIDFGKNASWLSFARKVDDVVLRVSSQQTLSRITSSVSASSLRLVEFASQLHTKRKASCYAANRTLEISGRELFVTTTQVRDLSLAELGDLVRYTTDMNRLDFNKKEFLSTVSDRVQEVSSEISKVIALSRGDKVSISTPPPLTNGQTTTIEDADALAFVAFVRIFAEWRSERLVPPGYSRYGAGMALAKRDLIQNLQKIETAVHSYLNDMETRNGAAVDFANGRQVCDLLVVVQDLELTFDCLVAFKSDTRCTD